MTRVVQQRHGSLFLTLALDPGITGFGSSTIIRDVLVFTGGDHLDLPLDLNFVEIISLLSDSLIF